MTYTCTQAPTQATAGIRAHGQSRRWCHVRCQCQSRCQLQRLGQCRGCRCGLQCRRLSRGCGQYQCQRCGQCLCRCRCCRSWARCCGSLHLRQCCRSRGESHRSQTLAGQGESAKCRQCCSMSKQAATTMHVLHAGWQHLCKAQHCPALYKREWVSPCTTASRQLCKTKCLCCMLSAFITVRRLLAPTKHH